MGETLLHQRQPLHLALGAACRLQGLNFSEEGLRSAAKAGAEVLERARLSGDRFEVSDEGAITFWAEHNCAVLRRLGLEGPLARQIALAEIDSFWSPTSWEPAAGVQCLLEALRGQGLRLALISNAPSRVREVLAAHRLTSYFDVLIVSAEIGCQKPEAQAFSRASAALGLSPGEMVHVGDDWHNDILGALGAGMKAVWYQRGAAPGQVQSVPVVGELLKVLEVLGPVPAAPSGPRAVAASPE